MFYINVLSRFEDLEDAWAGTGKSQSCLPLFGPAAGGYSNGHAPKARRCSSPTLPRTFDLASEKIFDII